MDRRCSDDWSQNRHIQHRMSLVVTRLNSEDEHANCIGLFQILLEICHTDIMETCIWETRLKASPNVLQSTQSGDQFLFSYSLFNKAHLPNPESIGSFLITGDEQNPVRTRRPATLRSTVSVAYQLVPTEEVVPDIL